MALLSAVAGLHAAELQAGAGASHVAVTDLRCEYLSDPHGIDTPLPRFSWKLADPDKTRGQRQTAYRIVVEAGDCDGAQAKAVLWDSGKVESPESLNNVYGGVELTSGRICAWKVRVCGRRFEERMNWAV